MTSPSFEAQLYAPGLAAAGEPVRVEMRSRAFVLHHLDGRESEVEYSRVRASASGWRGEALLVEWDGDDGACGLSVQRPEAVAALRVQGDTQQ